jgi:hypothetical protein
MNDSKPILITKFVDRRKGLVLIKKLIETIRSESGVEYCKIDYKCTRYNSCLTDSPQTQILSHDKMG